MQSQPGQSTRNAMNLFLILFLVIGALLTGSVTLFYRSELKTILSEMKEQETIAISRQSDAIGDKFDAIVGDLLFLSRQNELHAYLESEDASATKAIQAEYISLSLAKKNYDQIRYLDAQGMEKVRVNFYGGSPDAVPREKLQRKGNRYYFTDAFALGQGEIFVSPLDLNVEQGQVEIPFKSMIRFGTPVLDKNGVKRGVLLLNHLAANLLDFIEKKRAGENSYNK